MEDIGAYYFEQENYKPNYKTNNEILNKTIIKKNNNIPLIIASFLISIIIIYKIVYLLSPKHLILFLIQLLMYMYNYIHL